MTQTMLMIGNTPLYQWHENIYVKLEKYNPAGSIKDRAVLYMLQDAIDTQRVNKNSVLVEATSGNTGIALALMGSLYQIPVKIIMPESMSEERRKLVKAYGAELILTPKELGMQGSIDCMNELLAKNANYVSLNQFENPANIEAHYRTTAVELMKEVPDMDMFVACVGTGGTFSGIAKALKEYNPKIRTVAGEPLSSPVLSTNQAGSHAIQGIGANFVPKNFLREYVDDIMMVSDEEAISECVRFARETGILVGISSGANLALAKRLASYYPEAKIVTVAPDGGEKYLSVLDFES